MARDVAEVTNIAERAVVLLQAHVPVTRAYLFGSYVEGTAREDSDIDIAAFSPAVDTMDLKARVHLAVEVEREIGDPVELHLFGKKDLDEARPSNFFGYLLKRGKPIL